jgi:hypothetical protein
VALDLIEVVVSRSGSELVIQAQVAGAAQIDGFHMYIDTDADQSTGFNTTNILGADRMIEGATIYSHAGANQADWNWTNLGTATYEFTGSVLTLRLPLAMLGLETGDQVQVSFSTTDAAWAPADWMPDGEPRPLLVP